MDIFNTKLFDKLITFIEKSYYVLLSLILILTLFNLFYNLGNFPICSWDEARHGISAYEMIKRKNYIVNTYAYNNDYWNLKPPISYWFIILGYKLAGFTPLGLRLFSAISSLLTIIIAAFYTKYKYGALASLISTFILSTTTQFILEHCARTGDADSLFLLFFTASLAALSLVKNNIRWLYVSGMCFAAAFLTKSWHSGSIFIIILLYLLLCKMFKKQSIKQILLLAASCTLPILLWAILRFSQDNLAFLKNMISYDLIARTSRPLEDHVGDAFYYLDILQQWYFYGFVLLIATALASTLLLSPSKLDGDKKGDVIILILWIIVPFLLYTKAKTKIAWYILPVYPAMAIWIGAASSSLLKCRKRNLLLQLLLIGLIMFSITRNEVIIIKSISRPGVEKAQILFKNLEGTSALKGKRIYIHHFEQSYWLCAELYLDLVPVEGGIEGFLKDTTSDTLLFITKDSIDFPLLENLHLKILAENEAAYIFSR